MFSALFLACAWSFGADSVPDNWLHWRGPTGQGYCEDKRVPLAWSETHNLLWKTALPGQGNSSPIIFGDRLFLTSSSPDGRERHVLCVAAADGKLLWQQLASREGDPGKTHEWNGYASASCATDGRYVYAFFGTPGLFCYDYTGRLIWKHSFGTFTSQTGWGFAASPFLFEDLVIQNCDNDGPDGLPAGHDASEAAPMSLVALDKATGAVRWQVPRNQKKGYSTPLLVRTAEGRLDLLLNGPYGVWAYNPRTGEEIWHCERHKGDSNALFGEPLPVYNHELLFAASGRPGPLQAVRMGGSGDITGSHVVWDVARKGSRDVASPILWGNRLYIADRYGMLSAYDPQTGKLLFKERLGTKPVTASPVVVQDKLLFIMEDGTTFVLEPGDTLKVVGRNRLSDGTEFRASPAIVNGRLYLRSQSHLYCVGESK
jgi:outer membrane protein assembly factor BamB